MGVNSTAAFVIHRNAVGFHHVPSAQLQLLVVFLLRVMWPLHGAWHRVAQAEAAISTPKPSTPSVPSEPSAIPAGKEGEDETVPGWSDYCVTLCLVDGFFSNLNI